jgi:hypothetical protein
MPRTVAQRVTKLLKLSWHERGLIVEAMLLMCLARMAVAFVPVRRLVPFFCRVPTAPPRSPPLELVRQVRWAVERGAVHAPFRAVCFPQGIVAQDMLRRRGVVTTLHFGAALHDAKLDAHVWVQWGEMIVVGGQARDGYPSLVSYPADHTVH